VRPLVVVEGSNRAFGIAVGEVERSGARLVKTWQQGPTVTCVGVVADADDAAEALLAAVWGAGLVVHAQAEREVVDRLVDDLHRLGPVEHRVGEPEPDAVLTAEERALLELIAGGATLGEAATSLHLSRRTADRRLASAKRKLGATSTAQLVVSFRRQ
jgi:DNA-binding CsgD family transcriptional regulator